MEACGVFCDLAGNRPRNREPNHLACAARLCQTAHMRRLIPLSLPCLLLLASSLNAQEAMSTEAFDAYTRGKTFYYGSGGMAYGAEEYLSDRRVRWSFLDGECQEGRWYEEAGEICFVYENRPEPQCWTFTRGPEGLVARFVNDPFATELYEVEQSDEPLSCPGPKIGV